MSSLIVVNAAKKDQAKPWLEALKPYMDPFEVYYSEDAAATTSLIQRHAARAVRIIIGGGDGTMRSAAGALIEAARPVGILPLGTANDLARSLSIPVTPRGAAQVIRAGHTRAIDVALVNGRHFFNAAQLGLGATVKKQLSPRLNRLLGPLVYALGAWDAMRRMRPFDVSVRVDGQESQFESIHVTVGNGVRFGGGTPVAPDARLDDGRLDLLTVDPVPPWQLAVLAAAVRAGRHHSVQHLHLRRGARMHIETSRDLRITADGEEVSRTPADFSILPKAVSVYTGGTKKE